MRKSTVYINGRKATAKDLNKLELDVKAGKQKVYAVVTGDGIFYRTQF